MQIGKDYKVESDAMNVTLYERRIIQDEHKGKPNARAGEETWDTVGYYSTLQGALSGMIDHDVMGNGLEDFKAIVKRQNELERLIKSIKPSSKNAQTRCEAV